MTNKPQRPVPWDTVRKFVDKEPIQGIFVQRSSREEKIASGFDVKTVGKFATFFELRPGDVVRSESDGRYIRMIGEAVKSPDFAALRVRIFDAEVLERGKESE